MTITTLTRKTALTGTGALLGVGLNVATGVVGLGLAWVVLRRERRRLGAVPGEG